MICEALDCNLASAMMMMIGAVDGNCVSDAKDILRISLRNILRITQGYSKDVLRIF